MLLVPISGLGNEGSTPGAHPSLYRFHLYKLRCFPYFIGNPLSILQPFAKKQAAGDLKKDLQTASGFHLLIGSFQRISAQLAGS